MVKDWQKVPCSPWLAQGTYWFNAGIADFDKAFTLLAKGTLWLNDQCVTKPTGIPMKWG